MPNSFAFTLIWRRSRARMVLWVMGISYCLPVRLSVMVSVSRGTAAASWLAVSGDGFTGFIFWASLDSFGTGPVMGRRLSRRDRALLLVSQVYDASRTLCER